jgi:glycosyltransferase involved in cell wall biosynthesis
MYHADLVGGLAARLAGVKRIVWSIRQGALTLRDNKLRTLVTMRLCAALSYLIPNVILCCGETPRRNHIAYGYARRKMEVIPNGFELDRFEIPPGTREATRRALNIADDQKVLMVLGRFAPQKGHHLFVEAAGEVYRSHPDALFLMVGRDLDENNTALMAMVRNAGIESASRLLGQRSDVPELLSSADIFVNPSLAEGFPNVVGEAMASRLACVGTDAGETAILIGDAGTVVPTGDATALATAMQSMLALSHTARHDLGEKARTRVHENFTMGRILQRYREFYERIAPPAGKRPRPT